MEMKHLLNYMNLLIERQETLLLIARESEQIVKCPSRSHHHPQGLNKAARDSQKPLLAPLPSTPVSTLKSITER